MQNKMVQRGTGRHKEQRKDLKMKNCGNTEETGDLLSFNVQKTETVLEGVDI
jgi:hypothetical protein